MVGNRSTVQAYARFSPKNFDKWTKHTVAEHISIGGNGPVLIGTPEQVADGLEAWVDEADVDGFNFVCVPFSSFHSNCISTISYTQRPSNYRVDVLASAQYSFMFGIISLTPDGNILG